MSSSPNNQNFTINTSNNGYGGVDEGCLTEEQAETKLENAKQASCLFLRPIPAHCFSGGGGVGSDVLVNPTKVLPGTTPSKDPCGGFVQLCPPGTTPQSPGGTTPETTQPPGGTIGTTDKVADGSVPAGPDGNCPGGLVKTSVGVCVGPNVPKGAEGNTRLGHSKQTQLHVQGEHRLAIQELVASHLREEGQRHQQHQQHQQRQQHPLHREQS